MDAAMFADSVERKNTLTLTRDEGRTIEQEVFVNSFAVNPFDRKSVERWRDAGKSSANKPAPPGWLAMCWRHGKLAICGERTYNNVNIIILLTFVKLCYRL